MTDCQYPDVKPRTSYAYGCRCPRCRAANADAQSQWRRDNDGWRWLPKPSVPPVAPHRIVTPLPWMAQADCRDWPVDVFFPEPWSGENGRLAKSICAECPVRETCAEHGIANETYGIWGGLSERERRRIRKQRRLATAGEAA